MRLFKQRLASHLIWPVKVMFCIVSDNSSSVNTGPIRSFGAIVASAVRESAAYTGAAYTGAAYKCEGRGET